MTGHSRIVDFDTAYDNSGAVPDAASFRDRWPVEAAAFRSALQARGRASLDRPYGTGERQRYDLFLPEGEAEGVAVFVHGGYWKAFDRSVWSHLARGALERGHAVAFPSYTLCPGARIAQIGEEIGAFLDRLAAEVAGPIRLAGHSAGGHLVTRMVAAGAPILPATAARIASVVSISGVHDLRPIMRTRMNEILRIDREEAMAESPALLEPVLDVPVTAYVGGAELAEFRRQTAFLASSWRGLGARVETVEAEGRHHFDVIADLSSASSRLTQLLTAPGRL